MTSTVTSGSSSLASTLLSVVAVKKNSTQTMITGTTTQKSSSGTLYWNCRGSASSPEADGFFRWKAIVQNIRPHTMTPTTRAATTDQVQKVRMLSASGVTPSGHPNRRTSSPEHPVASTATSPASTATLATLPRPEFRVRSGTPTARCLLARSLRDVGGL